VGGIVVAVGEGAERAVVRGAAAVERRPWQAPRLWSTERVAFGLCAERGGLAAGLDGTAAVIDGELLVDERPLTGKEAAEHLLHRFRASGERFRPPSGQFAAALWAETSGLLVLVTDRLGTRPLHLCRTEGSTLAATEQKALLAAGATPRLELDGAAQLLAYEHLLGAMTLLEGIRLLPPASTTVIDASGERTIDRGRYGVEPAPAAELDECVETFGRLLEAAVLRRRDDRTALALSGGLDSRCLATVIGRHRPGTRAYVFGSRGTEELGRASAVARLTSLDLGRLELEHGYVARDALEAVWLTEGQIRCFHSHPVALRRAREDGMTALLVGYAGDVVVRTTGLPSVADRAPGTDFVDATAASLTVAIAPDRLERVLTRRFAAELRGRAREALSRELSSFDGPEVVRLLDFAIHASYRRKVLPGVELYADDVVHRDPYVDDDLLDFLARVPLPLRLSHAIQLAYLRRFPALAKIPSPKTGVAPGLSGRRLAVARSAVRARRGLRSRTDRLLRRAGLPPRSGYSDYTSHLRGPAGLEILGVLLDERTLDRGQIDAHGVRELVEKMVAGREAHTQVLGVLLTLELFQRQLVDGDGLVRPNVDRDDRDERSAYAEAP
jgi:asparagine synthetase B (glutamine-hydrolysing)